MPVNINAGGTTAIKTDQVGADHYQVIKLDGGGAGASVLLVAVAAGDVLANPTALPQLAHQVVFNGATWDRRRAATVFKDLPAVAIVAATPATVWTPAAGKRFRLMGGWLSSSVATTVVLKYAAANTTLFRTPVLVANTPWTLPDLGQGAMPGAVNDALKCDVLANATVTAVLFGVEE